MFCVTTQVCNTLFYVTIKFHRNTSMNVLQESVTISLFCSSESPTLQALLDSQPDKHYTTIYLSKCKSLRAMQVRLTEKFLIKPSHLQHLRYLNFSGNWLIKELPQEISLLYNLLTMDLSNCRSLCRLQMI